MSYIADKFEEMILLDEALGIDHLVFDYGVAAQCGSADYGEMVAQMPCGCHAKFDRTYILNPEWN